MLLLIRELSVCSDNIVSTGVVSREMGRLYSKVYELRQSGDYDDWISIGEEDILPLVAYVDEYLTALKRLIDE